MIVTFVHPLRLELALAAALAVVWACGILSQKRLTSTIAYSNVPFLKSAIPKPLGPLLPLACTAIAGLLLVAAALGAPRVSARVAAPSAVYLCIDTSGSMLARDIGPTRAEAARRAALAFIQGANASTRIGIIRFSESARIERFPTLNRADLERTLDDLPQPDGGTAIGDAMLLAGRSLPRWGRRAVFLITDGVNNRGTSPDLAIATLRALHVSVYAAGVGGGNSFDERALRRYARATGGSFASATDAPALNAALAAFGRTATFGERTADISVGLATTGSVLLTLALFAGLDAGRYP
ncbi:MAG: VWA domain-containing protein [Candidatus Eremiobacteraeota bacterium]|nr:VWA domain-containing protein [Candidatus Eremiobacteraeota bacterium]